MKIYLQEKDIHPNLSYQFDNPNSPQKYIGKIFGLVKNFSQTYGKSVVKVQNIPIIKGRTHYDKCSPTRKYFNDKPKTKGAIGIFFFFKMILL